MVVQVQIPTVILKDPVEIPLKQEAAVMAAT